MGYQIMFYGGLALSIVSLALAIYFFIKYQIKQVLADITGFKFTKSKERRNYHYHADLTESGRRTTTNDIELKEAQVFSANKQAIEETELINDSGELEGTKLLTVKETELLTELDDTILLEESEEKFIIAEDMIIVDSNEVIENGGKKVV